jgi:hypothetical protein
VMGGQGQVEGRPGSSRRAARVRYMSGQGQVMGGQGQVEGRPGSGC